MVYAVDIQSVFAPAKTFPTYGSLVTVIVRNAMVLAGVVSFVLLIVGGLGIIMNAGSGDSKKLEEGKKAITGAVVGLIVVVTSVLLVQVLATITGSPVLKQIIGVR